jgi:hypothetical protein
MAAQLEGVNVRPTQPVCGHLAGAPLAADTNRVA